MLCGTGLVKWRVKAKSKQRSNHRNNRLSCGYPAKARTASSKRAQAQPGHGGRVAAAVGNEHNRSALFY